VASASFMRLSLLRGAHAALSSAAWQEIRVPIGMNKRDFRSDWMLVQGTAGPPTALRSGRDDKFVGSERLNCRSLGYARDDKGEGDAFMESSCRTEGGFITLGGPQAHD
jgi:hypothetical protein